jgi:hypothetical protein
MEGFGAQYAVTLHRAELRQEAVQAHPHHEINSPSLRLAWRFAIARAKGTTTLLRRNPAAGQILRLLAVPQVEPKPDQHLSSSSARPVSSFFRSCT